MSSSRVLLLVLALALLVPARRAAADDLFVLPVKLSLPVQVVVGSQIVKRVLKENDFVNLALGRPLGTKVDKKTEILAAVVSLESGFKRAVVYDPSQNGLAQITTTVIEPTTDVQGYETAFLGKSGAGSGVGTGRVLATTLGSPAQNGLLASDLWTGGGGKATGSPFFFGTIPKVSASVTGVVAGRLRFTVTENGLTSTIQGFIVKGKGKVSGPLLGVFDDGSNAGCGDGIIQPGLGEECEFVDQTACPGKCNACICIICGNNRVDPGEICDNTSNAICDAQLPPVPCKPDCSGCDF